MNGKLPVGVQEYTLDDLERARGELAASETPYEPFEQLARLLQNTTAVDEYVWLMVPWKLVGAFLKVVQRAKDTCNPRWSYELIGILARVEHAVEDRDPIDRLGDLVA
jgi:hypothetical protein